VKGALAPYGESRPAWKVLRVLGNLFQCKGFEYESTQEVLSEIKDELTIAAEQEYTPYYPECLPVINHTLIRVGEWPLYRVDSIVRNARELQLCAAADTA